MTPEDVRTALQAASTHFNTGRYVDSAALADSILAHDPANAEALHVAGLSRVQLGRTDVALPLLERAVKARKSDDGFANSLALAYLALGQTEAAAKTLEPLARKNKLSAPGLNTLGDCRLRQGDPTKAKACFEKALKLQPNLTPAQVNLGEALKQSGDLTAAIQHYETVIKANPTALSAWRNYGLALIDAERFHDSLAPLNHYLTHNPNDVATRMSLGSSYSKLGATQDALDAFQRALTQSPDNVEALNNLGVTLRTLNRTEEAARAFQRVLELNPEMTSARGNLAHMLYETEGIEAALPILNEGISLAPDDPRIHMARSHPLLSEGRIAEGWPDYQWRFQMPPDFSGKKDHPYPTWEGSNLSGKTILVWGEQGVGDEILYASMLADLIKIAEHVILDCEARLAPIFTRSFPSITVVARTTPASEKIRNAAIDFQSSIGDLAAHLRPDLDAFTEGLPYLLCDQGQKSKIVDRYRSRNARSKRIGIAWFSGRPSEGWQKTIPLDQWAPILRQRDAAFYSLQYGDHAQEIAATNAALDCDIFTDPEVDALKNMDTFTSQVAAMDLVITNSNTAAHVAGAIGVPVWTIVPRAGRGALWYWFKTGNQSPWYKSMTLYRQTTWHNWTDTIEIVARDLSIFLSNE